MAGLGDGLTDVVGARTAKALAASLDLHTVGDLLRHYPRRYARRGELTDLDQSRVEAEPGVGEGIAVALLPQPGRLAAGRAPLPRQLPPLLLLLLLGRQAVLLLRRLELPGLLPGLLPTLCLLLQVGGFLCPHLPAGLLPLPAPAAQPAAQAPQPAAGRA